MESGVIRILVVDECHDTVEIVCTLLNVLGLEALGAETGAGALALARELEPDIVFLDLVLPDISGYDLATRLRDRMRRRCYLAALTALGTASDRARTLAAGFDEHLLKPVAMGDLRDAVWRASIAGVDVH